MSLTTPVDAFLRHFVPATNSKSPEVIKAKMRHWIDVANANGLSQNDLSKHALQYHKRKARQNLSRLAEKHPEIASILLQEDEGIR